MTQALECEELTFAVITQQNFGKSSSFLSLLRFLFFFPFQLVNKVQQEIRMSVLLCSLYIFGNLRHVLIISSSILHFPELKCCIYFCEHF